LAVLAVRHIVLVLLAKHGVGLKLLSEQCSVLLLLSKHGIKLVLLLIVGLVVRIRCWRRCVVLVDEGYLLGRCGFCCGCLRLRLGLRSCRGEE